MTSCFFKLRGFQKLRFFEAGALRFEIGEAVAKDAIYLKTR